MYLVQGPPGSGKTILANQACADVARRGGRALYVSLLAESFAGMLHHMRRLSFFDPKSVGTGTTYLSGFGALEEGGLSSVLALLRTETQRHSAELVVIDALPPNRDSATSDLQYKRRLLDLQALASLSGFTTLLLSTQTAEPDAAVVHQIADGIIELGDEAYGVRAQRTLVVSKFRGGATLRGRHAFRIGRGGLEVFPRLESQVREGEPVGGMDRRLRTGIGGLDRMLGGGLPSITTTGIIGAPGTGKTSVGLQFIGGATRAEPGLIFGLYESPASLRAGAATFGVDLARMEREGALHIDWQPQGEHLMDELAHRLLRLVESTGARRVLVDGYEAFVQANVHPDRITRFLTALSIELRRLGATVIMSAERDKLLGLGAEVPVQGASPILDNVLLVRHVEQHGRLVRLLSIIKLRGSGFDTRVYTFEITDRGIEVGAEWNPQGTKGQS